METNAQKDQATAELEGELLVVAHGADGINTSRFWHRRVREVLAIPYI